LPIIFPADASSGSSTEGVNTKGYRDNTPLHLACQQGHYELCKLLIERGANAKSRNAAGCTPLHEAVLAPHGARITVLLIKSGADLNGKDHDDRTPLHKASSMGHIEHCKALIDIGANINILDQSKCRLEMDNNKSPLKGAVGMGDSALHYAILSGNIEMCVYLLDRGIDMHIKSAQGKPIVHFACHHKKYKICALLIDRGADIDALDYRQVQIPSGAPRKIMKTQPNESFMLSLTYSETALQNAAQSGNTEACQLLISKGAEVSAADEIFGNTALHLAAQEGHREVCAILLRSGAEIGATNRFFDSESEWNREDTALHIAAREGHWDVCQLLIESGADVWCKNRMHQHCLAVAERSIRPALLQLVRRLKPEDQQKVGIWEAMSRSISVVRPTIPASGSNSSLSTAAADPKPTSAARAASADQAAGSNPAPATTLTLINPAQSRALSSEPSVSGNNTPSEAPPSPSSLNAVTPYCGPEKVWKHRKLRFSTRRNVFSQTVWECEILELSSRPGEGTWVTTVPSTSAPPRRIPVYCVPGDVEVERNGVIDVRLVFTLQGAKHSHLKLSFGTDRARRSAWKAAFMKHLRNGK
jgi:ankyrin repeat protein